ncbi:hypothetical protein E2K80_14670 [Rhodophyticola sp. CCM32]|nr:hypothetical protein E2K80_14670 [Rhodophyticola sp. CCM32]
MLMHLHLSPCTQRAEALSVTGKPQYLVKLSAQANSQVLGYIRQVKPIPRDKLERDLGETFKDLEPMLGLIAIATRIR